jgi:hypothetical protein
VLPDAKEVRLKRNLKRREGQGGYMSEALAPAWAQARPRTLPCILPVFISRAVRSHLGAARFWFCRGETGQGGQAKALESLFVFSLAAKACLRSQLLVIDFVR